MEQIKYPGKCPEPEKEGIALSQKRAEMIAKFIIKSGLKCAMADIGSRSVMTNLLSNELRTQIYTIDTNDFNFDSLNSDIMFNTILCFEVLEHLQNPLWFLKQVKSLLKPDGVLYLSIPNRHKYFWTEYHYHEMSGEHIQKWLLNPLDLMILRDQKLRYIKHWTDYLIGFRPLFRALRNMNFKPLLCSLNNVSYIYEIRHK